MNKIIVILACFISIFLCTLFLNICSEWELNSKNFNLFNISNQYSLTDGLDAISVQDVFAEMDIGGRAG